MFNIVDHFPRQITILYTFLSNVVYTKPDTSCIKPDMACTHFLYKFYIGNSPWKFSQTIKLSIKQFVAEGGLDPPTSGLWAQHASPLFICFSFNQSVLPPDPIG